MKKILLAVMSAFLFFGSFDAQADLQSMKNRFRQHKVEHKQKVKTRREAFKAQKEAREADMAEKKRIYEERMAAEQARQQGDIPAMGEQVIQPVTGDENAEPIDNRTADEIQAEIEQTLKELRENVDNLQTQVNDQVEATTISKPDTSE